MARASSKRINVPLTLHSEYTEYTICIRCRRVNRIDVGHGYGISHEIHERGACLLIHPNWLDGRYATYEEAASALRIKLGRWEKRQGKNRSGDGLAANYCRRDRRAAAPASYFGPERRRRGAGASGESRNLVGMVNSEVVFPRGR